MTTLSGLFNRDDQIQIKSLDFRTKRNAVILGNIANAETPGFRALEYNFEEQLQSVNSSDESKNLKTTLLEHKIHPYLKANYDVMAEVLIQPTESVTHDGNTVDVDREMSDMAKNQILYRSIVETINRKIGTLKYAINGGR